MSCWGKTLALMLIALFLLTLVTTSIAAVFANASPSWDIQTVDKNRVTNGIFIALDSNNSPHLAYSKYLQNRTYDLMYANWNDSNWNFQTVTQGYASTIDFALDSNDYPHILYYNQSSQSGLEYVSWNGSSWIFQSIGDPGGPTGSLALDSNGNPNIAYVGDNKYLKYATWTGSEWTIQTLEQTIGIEPVSLALDSSNNPHIMYNIGKITPRQISSTLKYAIWNNISESWNFQTVMANAFIVHLALDSNSFPHFTCVDDQPPLENTMTYGSWNNSNWETRVVFSNLLPYNGGYFALDSQNNPHIIYSVDHPSSGWEADLIYASWTGNSWDTQIIDSHATAAGSIVLDSSGNPHVCYLGNVTKSPVGINTAYLMYATAIEPPHSPTPTSSSPIDGLIPSITLAVIATVAILAVAVVSLLLYKWHRKESNKNRL